MKRYLILLFVLASGCASTPEILSSSTIPVVQNNALPAPEAVDLVGGMRPYLIGPFDTLAIDVFGIPDLSRGDVQADASGQISFPLIGGVQAAGLTPEQLSRTIEDRLRGRFVRDPQVTVNLKQTVSQVVTVDGQVVRPGLYPVIGRVTLQRAVATAGGVGEYAELDDVVIFRTVEGQRMAGLYNLEAIRTGVYEDPEVFSNDIVVVGDSQGRKLFQDVLRSSSLITTPLLILFRN